MSRLCGRERSGSPKAKSRRRRDPSRFLAEGEGFEPPVRFPVQRFSSSLACSGATYVLTNTNAAITCAPPAVAGLAAKFCTQVQPSRVSQTVKISGNSPVGVARMELWIDGKKSYGLWSDQLSFGITLAPGPHRIAAVTVDQFGHYAESVQLVTVP